jgi:hypothetical protein
MATWRRCALGALVLVAGLRLPATAAPVSLAGTTVVTGSRTGSMLVRLPRAVDVTMNDFTTFSPQGRMTAVVLKKTGAWDAPYVSVTHAGYCGAPGCAATFPRGGGGAYIWAPGSSNGTSGRLPAGTYRLYLVTDGGPATFTFRLKGLSGSRRLTPREPARAAVVAPKPTMAEPAASPATFAGGSARKVPSTGGLNATVVWKEVPTFGVPSATGSCEYAGKAKAGVATPAFQAPCDGGRGDVPPWLTPTHDTGQATTPVGPGRFVTGFSTGYLLPGGEYAIGGYHNTPGPVTAAYVHQLWLDF